MFNVSKINFPIQAQSTCSTREKENPLTTVRMAWKSGWFPCFPSGWSGLSALYKHTPSSYNFRYLFSCTARKIVGVLVRRLYHWRCDPFCCAVLLGPTVYTLRVKLAVFPLTSYGIARFHAAVAYSKNSGVFAELALSH